MKKQITTKNLEGLNPYQCIHEYNPGTSQEKIIIKGTDTDGLTTYDVIVLKYSTTGGTVAGTGMVEYETEGVYEVTGIKDMSKALATFEEAII